MTEPIKQLNDEDNKKIIERADTLKGRHIGTLLRGFWHKRRKFRYTQPHVPAKGTLSVG